MPKLDVKALKSEAEKYRGKGKLDKAIEIYEQIRKAGQADAKILHKMAEIYLKLDRDEEGVEAYRSAMKEYLKNGFLVQAIAVGKILQELLPDDKEINKEVEEILAKKRGPSVSPPRQTVPVKTPAPEIKTEPKPEPKPVSSPTVVPEAKPAVKPIEIPEPETIAEKERLEKPPSSVKKPAPSVIELPEEIGIDEELAKLLEEAKPSSPKPEKKKGPAIEVPEEILAEEQIPEEEIVPEPEVIEEIEAEKSSIDFLLFADLNEQEFKELYQKLRSLKVPAGVRICKEEEEGDSIFIIVEGNAEVFKRDAEGVERLVGRLKPGDFFGEFAYFTGGKRQASVQATSEMELLEIPKKEMDQILEKYPQVKKQMLKFYKERVLDNLLALSPLTSCLKPEDRKKLIESLELKEVEPGEIIVKEGDPGDSMFLIKNGKVEVTTLDPRDRRKLTLARLSTGEFFGEVSLIKNKPRTATITALTPTELLCLNRAKFEELSNKHPELVQLLEQTIEKRVEETIKKIIGEKE